MTTLTDQQKQFIEISKRYETLKNELSEVKEKYTGLLQEIGVGTAFQDPDDGTVFEIVVPKGRFVYNEIIGYDRTRRDGERSGSLSLKRAKELGYNI